MNRSDAPAKQSKPFGINGQREPILPTTPSGDNTASYESGFPPITMILKSAGGLPPKGQDMNQILFELSALGRWSSSGAMNTYDSDFANAIGGYPAGSFVLGDDLKTVYRCTTDGNTANPNSVTTGWSKVASDIANILLLGTAAYKNVGTTSGQIPDMSAFTSGAGWQKLPSGKIIQWGVMTTSTTVTASATFPIAFPIACRTVASAMRDVTQAGACSVGNYNTTSFQANSWSLTDTTTGAKRSSTEIAWIAIGE